MNILEFINEYIKVYLNLWLEGLEFASIFPPIVFEVPRWIPLSGRFQSYGNGGGPSLAY